VKFKLISNILLTSLVSAALFVALLQFSNSALAASEPSTSQDAFVLGPPNSDGPVEVGISFQLRNIDEIDDEQETFQFTGTLVLTWTDPRQAFDPEQAQVKEKVFQGNYQFDELSPSWYPQVALSNESGEYEVQGVVLRIKPDGSCKLITSINATAEGNFRMRRFPFDTQQLDAIFYLVGFDKKEVVLKAGVTSSQAKLHISQWRLDGVTSEVSQNSAPYLGINSDSSTFVVSINVSRRSFFMLRLVVYPLTLIVILSWSVFWMERSSLGDRINVSFIGILTAVAYQIVVGGILPHISYVTLMNTFLNISFLVMSATVVVNLAVGQLDRKGRSKTGDMIDRRCRIIFPIVYFGLIFISVIATFILSAV